LTARPQIVLGRAAEAEALAARLALEDGGVPVVHLREDEGSPLEALVPARRGARELASLLEGAGLEASARGGLVVVDGAGQPSPDLAWRVEEACGRVPVVALLRGRLPEDEALLERSEVIVADGAREGAVALLLAELDGRKVGAGVRAAPAGLAATMARAGLRLPGLGSSPGQASVEMLGLLPLLLAGTLACGQLLAAGVARELAGHAATAGAAALIQGRDASRAAERALPGWSRGRAKVSVVGRRVSVRVVPPGAGPLAGLLEARSLADAGPAP
jgi:hypothetical protein